MIYVKLIGFPVVYDTGSFVTVSTSALPPNSPDPADCSASPKPYFLKAYFNIIIPSTLTSC